MSVLEAAWLSYGGEDIPPHHGAVKMKCVLHDDSNASATVNVETGKWRCYAGCGHGDVYDLIGLAENPPVTEFVEQKRIARERFGDEGGPTGAPNKKRPGRKKWVPPWV